MGTKLAEVTLHIDESTSHDERESFRGVLLSMNGVIAASEIVARPARTIRTRSNEVTGPTSSTV